MLDVSRFVALILRDEERAKSVLAVTAAAAGVIAVAVSVLASLILLR